MHAEKNRPARLLIVEDERVVAMDLRDLLTSFGHSVIAVVSRGDDALREADREPPDLVLMDIELKGLFDGIETARRLRQKHGTPVVFLTAFADPVTLERARPVAPYGYLAKPFQEETLRATIQMALVRRAAESSAVAEPTPPIATRADESDDARFLGESAPMRRLVEVVRQLASVPATVLIEGETGTGKERVARALHAWSERRRHPFVAVNCAALTETLAASQLFGHRRGSFTGAHADQPGVFETAGEGTLFLDEIGDLPLSQQPFLLRALEEREIVRVGETQPRRVGMRVVCATNCDLAAGVAAGRFRADLFYRIRVGRVLVPPLRERGPDVELLARAFLDECGAALGRKHDGLSEPTLERLRQHPWPGNVRELRNAIEFAAIRCAQGWIEPAHLPPEFETRRQPPAESTDPAAHRARILEAIKRAGGNRTAAARTLGMSRATLYRRLEELGLNAPG